MTGTQYGNFQSQPFFSQTGQLGRGPGGPATKADGSVEGCGSRRRLAVHRTRRPAAHATSLDLLVPPPWMERFDVARSLATARTVGKIPTTFGPSSCGQPRPWPCARDPVMVVLRHGPGGGGKRTRRSRASRELHPAALAPGRKETKAEAREVICVIFDLDLPRLLFRSRCSSVLDSNHWLIFFLCIPDTGPSSFK
jgi:hypothetical protein